MRGTKSRRSKLWAAWLLPLVLFASPGCARPADSVSVGAAFDVERLADGVLLFRPAEGRGDLTNSLVVERDDGLLVVESQRTPGAAREFLEALKGVHDETPRYLVLTHPHAESAGGVSAFPPSTLVIGSEGCRDALQDPQFDFAAESRSLSGKSGPWSDPPRVPPTLVLFARTRLEDARHPVELLPAAHAHTSGDLLVQLPDENIVYVGALLPTNRLPYAGDANIGGWLGLLNNVAKNSPSLIVPLSGPAVGVRELRTTRDSFAWVRGQVERAFVDGVNPERMPEIIFALEETPDHFDVETSPEFVLGVIRQAVEEALAHREKRGYL